VRLAHFHRFAPRCPVCARADRPDAALELHHVERRDGDDILEGALVCPSPACRFEYPILDGIPLLVPHLRDVLTSQLDAIRGADLSTYAESLLGDATGPGSEFDRVRYHLSTYGRSHWPAEADGGPGSITALLDAALDLLPSPPTGAWIDVGCSLGRSTFALAARTGDLALGLDLNLAMLRVARGVLRDGRARYPLRRVGIVYERVDLAVDPPARERVDFWACDATCLPLPEASAAGALSLNLLDCVNYPLAHLVELGRVVRPGGDALLSTPYDWSPGATPVEAWIGGHSQRAPHGGSSASELRRILSADDAAGAHTGLAIEAERDDVPWHVHVHERATMQYRVHLARARRL